MSFEILWWGFFTLITIIFVAILYKERDRKYIFYAIAGSLYGFILDFFAVSFGYYNYPIYVIRLFDLSPSVIIAEGLSVAFTIYLFNKLILPRITSGKEIR
jgi:hypothetical protein